MTTPAGLLLAPLLLLMAGCTTVRIYNASVTEEKYPGLLVLKIAPLPGATLTVTQGLGLTLAQRSATLGYLNESVFTAPDASGCRVFIVTNDAAEVDSALKALGRLDTLREAHCTVLVGGSR